MNNNKPKLDLEVNIPATLKLLQDKPATGTNNYGTWYLFGVEKDGEQFSFFATEPVAKFVSDNNLKTNDELKITKTITKNGRKNQVEYKLEIVNKGNGKVNVDANKLQTNGNGDANKHQANGNGNDKIKEDYDTMHECLAQSLQLQKDLGSVIDVNRIAITLFITRTKKNGNNYYNL